MGLLSRLNSYALSSTTNPKTGSPRRLNGQSNDKLFELLSKIQRSMTMLSKQDIGKWRDAQRYALNVERPNRRPLYSIYRDTLLDDQVETVTGNLVADVMSEEFYITKNDNTEKDERSSDFIERMWFYELLEYAILNDGWGHTLLERGEMKKIAGIKEFSTFEEIPRDHVIPEWGVVLLNINDTTGINFRDPMFDKSLLEIGKPHDLGRFLKAARPALYKKNMEAAWSQYAELFGMPIRIGKVSSSNTDDLDRMEEFLKNMGRSAYAVTDIEDKIEFAETSKGDAYMVFDKYLSRADQAISKIFLGQTMTTDNGSSKSQAEVHERVAKSRMWAMKLKLDFLINDKLLPMMRNNGYPIKEGQRFMWAAVDEITATDIAMDEFLVNNFSFKDLKYFERKYGVSITGLREFTTKDTPKKDVVKNAMSRIKQLRHKLDKEYNQDDCC